MSERCRYTIVQLDEQPGEPCPCGTSRRAFVGLPGNHSGTLHLVDIKTDSEVHYHRQLTEIYLVLEAEDDAAMELDGERVPVRPMTAIFIKPGVRHRAVGRIRTLVIPMPGHDPDDEWFD